MWIMNHNDKDLLIAVDGLAASGKGVIAKGIATHFKLLYMDTGKLYRSVAWLVLKKNIDPADIQAVLNIVKGLHNVLTDEDLSSENIGECASIVASIPEVRASLLGLQRRFARSKGGAVLDGRDIGSVVCPEADYKLFVTANLKTRAMRRLKELQEKGYCVTYDMIHADLRKRDMRDMGRSVAPLVLSESSVHIDTSSMNVNSMIDQVINSIYFNLKN